MAGLIIVIVASVGILFTGQRALGVVHTVRGWELTGRTVSDYRRSNMAFTVGDGLVFKLGGGDADLAQVSMSDYKVCSAEAPEAIYRTNTTEVIYLNRTGNWYFISRVPDHCKSGKKLMITVVANNAMNNNSNNNRAGFIFRGTSPRMRFGGHGTGGGGHGNGGASGNAGIGSIPKGHPSRERSRSSSTPQLSALDFEFRLVMAAFCSVLLAGPLFV